MENGSLTGKHTLCTFSPPTRLLKTANLSHRYCLCEYCAPAQTGLFLNVWKEYALLLSTTAEQFESLFPQQQSPHFAAFMSGYKLGIETFHPTQISEKPFGEWKEEILVVGGFADGVREGWHACCRAYCDLQLHQMLKPQPQGH